MKKFSLSLVISTFLFCNVFAQQDWRQMMQDHNAKLSDVQAAFYTWYNANKPAIDSDEDAVKPGEEHENDGNYMLFKRWEWLMSERTYPSGLRPDPAVIAKQYQDFLNTQNKKSTHKTLSTAMWTYAGSSTVPNGGDAGRVNRVRFDPTNTNIVYACSPSGGLWKSTNGGTSWSTNTDNLLGIGTSDVAIDPTNTKIMYLATGDGDGILGGFTTPSTIGVMKSTNGGATWLQTGLNYTLAASGPSYMTVNELQINPNNTKILLAATSFGLYYTNNAGISWNLAEGGSFKSVEFEPGNPNIVYATTSNAGYYRSTTGGQTFTAIALPSVSGSGRMEIGVTPAAPNYVYIIADNAANSSFQGLWLSTDTGKTFTEQATNAGTTAEPNLLGFSKGTGSDATQGQGWYTLSIAVSPTSATTLVVGGVNIWRSTNSGTSWTKVSSWTGSGSSYVHADIHHLTFVPGSGSIVYSGDDGGVNKTTSITAGTVAWTDLSNGLEIAEQYSIGLSGSNSTLWLTGWQDNGTNLATGGSWSEPMGGDGMTCFIDYSNNNYMYGEQYDGSFNISTNGGTTWNGITTGITETGPWNTPWLMDPMNSSTLFAGLDNVWKSTNRGTSWSMISTFGSTSAPLNTVAVAPSNDQYIYAASNGAIYGTTNGGTNWNNVTGDLPAAGISYIAIDPNNPLRLWVTISGYSPGNKVFMSSTGGTTWVNMSNGLPNLPANCFAYQGGGIDAMYVGTDLGVYYRDTTNTSGDWVSYNSGLPNVIIADLKIYAPGNILRAASYGRGTWQIALYQPAITAPVAQFTAFPVKLCINNVVQFTDTSSNEPTSWKWRFTGGSPDTSSLQNPVISYYTAGTYPVTEIAINSSGEDSVTRTSYITVNPLPTSPTVTQNNDTLFCTPATYAFYQWFKSGALIPGATSSRLTISAKGVYKLTVSDSNGCSASTTLVVSVLGINEILLNDFINVYPNPTSGNVQVQFDLPTGGDYEVSIANVLGQTIYSDKLSINGQYTENINLAGYSKGVYFLSIKGADSKGVKKILLY